MFSARQGDQLYGVVLLAEKLNVQTPHSKGIRDAADMMDRIMRFGPQQHVMIVSKKHFTGANGLIFDELDYTENAEYSAAMITAVENFLLTFKCNAHSASDLTMMTNSIAQLQKTK